jgi:hypothetical protein
MGFGYGDPYGSSYYDGGGVAALAPYVYDVALGGHPYVLDWGGQVSEPPLRFDTVPLTKEQQDVSSSPGEQSINPEALWRRLRESWHLGAGQIDADREESSPYRYRSSFGVDTLSNRNQACLLHATTSKVASANSNQQLIVVGSRLYYVNGTAVGYYTDIVAGSITAVTGLPGTAPSSIATDGFNVVTAHGAAGVYKTTRTTGVSASHITGSVSLLGFVRGRFLAAQGSAIYDITGLVVGASGALPGSVYTHGNVDFQWVGFAEGSGWIYAAGFSGGKSLIYKTAVREDATALDQFSVAAELPDGEVVSTIYGYLGRFVCIGTTKGWRLATVSDGGDLTVGVLVETPSPVLAFEAQGQFIWFGWGGYDVSETGLGRMSTESFVNPQLLQPAHASDLMVHGQAANITSIVTFDDRRVFSVDGVGVYYEADSLEAEGWIDSGRVTYGTNEPKVGLWFNVQHMGDQGEVEVLVSSNESAFVTVGTRDAGQQPMERLSIGELTATGFEFRVKLLRSSTDNTQGPCLLSWLFRSQPRSEVTNIILATIRLAPMLGLLNGTDVAVDVYEEIDFLERLHSSKEVTTWEQSGRIYSVIVDDFTGSFVSLINNQDGLGLSANSSVTLKLKRI